MPRLVAVEADLTRPSHCAVVASLLVTCDPTPASRTALAQALRTPRPLLDAEMDAPSLRMEPRVHLYERLGKRVLDRPGSWIAAIALNAVLVRPPRTKEEISGARSLLATSLPHLVASDLVADAMLLGEAYISGGVSPLAGYRRLHRKCPRDTAPLLRMFAALAIARGSMSSGDADAKRLRAIGRAEARARELGRSRLAASARIARRYVSWNIQSERGDLTLLRAFRTAVLSFGARKLWLPVNNLLWTTYDSAGISLSRARFAARVVARAHGEDRLQLDVAYRLFGARHASLSRTVQAQRLRYRAAIEAVMRNRFPAVIPASPSHEARLREYCHYCSFGIVASKPEGASHFPLNPGAPGFLPRIWAEPSRASGWPGTRKSASAARDAACAVAIRGEPLSGADLRLLTIAAATEVSWAYRLISSMALTTHLLGRGRVKQAAWACAQGEYGYRGLMALRKRRRVAFLPRPLREYVDHCRRVLESFEPPIPASPDPVRKLRQVARRLPRRQRPRPKTAIDALDAVITAGHSAPGPDLERRVVAQLARMLRARVLFHRIAGEFVEHEPQSVHTLSSWTLRVLVRQGTVTARRIKPRPEFWRPEQRRPGGVLCFPIGDGNACLARRASFTHKEVRTVRTVLRFLAERVAQPGERPAVSISSPPHGGAAPRAQRLVGSSRAWRRLLEQVWKVAPTDCAILLRGETGTGKELVARAIHQNSKRAQSEFVPVNCAAIAPDAMLSELFGHIRGAFTGASRAREGLVRHAHRGTLFLDEVGDMPPAMQVAMLRTLEEKSVRPVGSAREQRADVRILSATNLDIEQLVLSGLFREDLLHRLNVFEIRLPPLRDRLDDLPELVQHILGHMDAPKRLHMDALPMLARYGWPGNVRELRNVLQAGALLADGDEVTPDVIERILRDRGRKQAPARGRLAPRSEAVLRGLASHWRAAPDLAAELGVSTRTVNRELARLLESRLVESSGAGPARRYRALETTGRDPRGA